MKRATKREKRKRRKKRKQAIERLILDTELGLLGKRPRKEETWRITPSSDRTITLPPPIPGRRITIKASGPALPPGTKITVHSGSPVRMSPLVSGREPMTEEQLEKYFAGLFGGT